MSVTVTAMTAEHWPAVERIYAQGIATGHATFEAAPPSWEQFDAGKLPDHRLVALDDDGSVLGWAAASPVSDRCAYAGVVEHSVYVDPSAQGRGIGRTLLVALLEDARGKGVWTVQSGIFPENVASLAVHAAAGFRVVGTRERLGRMTYGPLQDQWRDVVLVEKRL
ncbi:GNAT family N-acetyltransferase [Cellulomonas sp. ICMP 17802]|uniref:GNAT family N-acetyltransferase n=1 Tax=Cellulomonas sp. ICMP 17802 TaxID=3239199 RepID=UPI00351B522B